MKKLLGIVVLGLLWCNVSYSAGRTYAIKISQYSIPDLSISVCTNCIADETWKIKGSCKGAVMATRVKIKEYGIADMTVKIKSYGIPDKNICIQNPEDLPEWFLKMLDQSSESNQSSSITNLGDPDADEVAWQKAKKVHEDCRWDWAAAMIKDITWNQFRAKWPKAWSNCHPYKPDPK